MSANNLSVEREFRYIVQWFDEWSDLQRDDFLPILADYLVNGTNGAIYMNGMISGLAATACLDKPMSLFQCRVSTNKIYLIIAINTRVKVLQKKLQFAIFFLYHYTIYSILGKTIS